MTNVRTTGADVSWMADMTSTKRIQHGVSFEPDISCAVRVHPPIKLEDVAAAFINEDFVLLSDWQFAGQLTFDVPEDLGLAVMTIRIEPFYIYQLTGERYDDDQQTKIDDLNSFIKGI